MAVMRVVPNPGQSQAEANASAYGSIGQAPLPQGNPPAQLPGSPPFQMPPLETRAGPAPSYASGPVGPATPPEGLPGPIYPGTWKDHSWHIGPGVKTSRPMYGALGSYGSGDGAGGAAKNLPSFMSMMKFGVVDNGILIILTAAGVGLDNYIAKTLKVPKGWGPIIGASVGNAISDGVAGMAEGVAGAAGVTVGALLPVVPVFIASNVMKKSPNDKVAQYILMGSSAAMVLWAFMKK